MSMLESDLSHADYISTHCMYCGESLTNKPLEIIGGLHYDTAGNVFRFHICEDCKEKVTN